MASKNNTKEQSKEEKTPLRFEDSYELTDELKKSIEKGLADIDAGRTYTAEKVGKHLGLV